jgi:hypothetical protein
VLKELVKDDERMLKTFNSLSRDYAFKSISDPSSGCLKSFNSLSRDYTSSKSKFSMITELSTPSLGITSPVGDISWNPQTFQLPLSGLPSPIPGFSGSPRLSAAAPLRTKNS